MLRPKQNKIRLLVLHTDEAMRSMLPDLLRACFSRSHQIKLSKVEVGDGNNLDQAAAVLLLKKQFDCIIVNLRLPAMLSIRIAELIHLARVPTRLILMSGAPQELGPGLSLYDGYIRVPFCEIAKQTLGASLGQELLEPHRFMGSQEHVDIAILNLLQRCDNLAPGCRGALHAFGMYRDAYLHRPWVTTENEWELTRAKTNERIDFLTEVSPLGFTERLSGVKARINASRIYTPAQKSFLSAQLNHLLDAFGLTLMNFRAETKEVLEGLERFGRMAEAGGADINAAGLREFLLRCSEPMGYIHQGVTQIVRLLPGAG
jgi:hypothetical protein